MAKRDRKPRKDKAGPKQVDRRGFMKMAGLGAGAASATVGLALPQVEAAAPVPQAQQAGYRETDHVKMYYKRAQF
jgi:anaerobic selenocysteine-containing dehydrogenase